jgi:hypothetical protein
MNYAHLMITRHGYKYAFYLLIKRQFKLSVQLLVGATFLPLLLPFKQHRTHRAIKLQKKAAKIVATTQALAGNNLRYYKNVTGF